MKLADLEISDSDAEKMPELFKKLRAGYLEWKKTSRLPNGEKWKPNMECDLSEACG